MSIVTLSRPITTTRPVTTSPGFGLLRLCSKSAPKSSSAPLVGPDFPLVSGIKRLPPPGRIVGSRWARNSTSFYRPAHSGIQGRMQKAFAWLRRVDRPARAHDAFHRVDHRLERQPRRVDHDRVGGG